MLQAGKIKKIIKFWIHVRVHIEVGYKYSYITFSFWVLNCSALWFPNPGQSIRKYTHIHTTCIFSFLTLHLPSENFSTSHSAVYHNCFTMLVISDTSGTTSLFGPLWSQSTLSHACFFFFYPPRYWSLYDCFLNTKSPFFVWSFP